KQESSPAAWQAERELLDAEGCGEELGRSERHPVTLRVIMRPPSQGPVGRGQLGLTGPQRERGQEGEMAALTTGSSEARLGS
ncbi:NADH-quinone oxidoreductase subunit C, partial [Dissostichus eleginoides]